MDVSAIFLRPIAAGDAPALARFYNGLHPATNRAFRPLGDKTSLDVCEQIIGENGIPPGNRFDLVCDHQRDIVGWAFLANLNTDRPDLGIVVAEIIQGKGVGKTLLNHLLDWARNKGIQRVYLMVVKDNQRAINMYEGHGFVTYDEEFDEIDQLPYFHMVAHLYPKASPSEDRLSSSGYPPTLPPISRPIP